MKNTLLLIPCFFFGTMTFAQNDTTIKSKPKPVNLTSRSNDHLMLQIGYTAWADKPDSFNTTGLPRAFNAYFMFDFPFKTSPHFSVAIGAGAATDNVYFEDTYIGIKDQVPSIPFKNVSDTNHFKKYKLATAWLEAPVEFRFSSNPTEPGKSLKIAIGAKIGTLVNAHTKGKTLQDKNDKTLISYTHKETSKRFFNTNRLSLITRIGYGRFTLFGSYSVTTLFKEGSGPSIRPFTIGLSLSGL